MPLTCDDQQFEPNLIIAIWYTEQRLTNKQFSSKQTDSFEFNNSNSIRSSGSIHNTEPMNRTFIPVQFETNH